MRFRRFIHGGAACLLFIGLTGLSSCYKREWTGRVDVNFTFSYDGRNLSALNDTALFRMPVVTAGDTAYVTLEEIRYFISQVYLIEESGKRVFLGDSVFGSLRYIDAASSGSKIWQLQDVPCGHYVGLGFTYGLNEADNVSRRFSNPPESLMFWPDALGGGYHYMQINGKWIAAEGAEPMPFGLHTGIGQTWENGVATAFHQNYVRFEFPKAFSLFLSMKGKISATVNMEVAQWFVNPHAWDFAVQGGAIMQNQAAQQILKDNAWNVFSVR